MNITEQINKSIPEKSPEQKTDAIVDDVISEVQNDNFNAIKRIRDKEQQTVSLPENDKSESQSHHKSQQGFQPSQGNDKSVTNESPDKKLKDSKIAKQLSHSLKNELAWDDTCNEWYRCKSGVWRKIPARGALRIINKKLSEIYLNGFSLSFLNNITQFLQLYLYNDSWNKKRHLLPLSNCVLNLKTMEKESHLHNHKFTWQLPFNYNENDKCPAIIEWLIAATNKDDDMLKTIQACFYLALTGTSDIQKFLEVVGAGGTGKSTLTRLFEALVGKENHVTTDLKNLENNRFESAIFYEKKLALINDSSRYGGEVSMLKAITGGDLIRFEQKNKQQGDSFKADCLIIIASNEAIQSTDYSSGMTRRRVPIIFNHRVTDEEKEKWRERGGLEHLMHQELSGLLNWVLELSLDDVRNILGGTGYSIQQRHHMVNTNKIAEWLEERCVLIEGNEIYTGSKPRGPESDYDIKKKLYPNYLDWCECSGVKPVALQRFGSNLIDLCESLTLPVKRLKKDRNGRKFIGLDIRNNNHNDIPQPVTGELLCDGKGKNNDEQMTHENRTSDKRDEGDSLYQSLQKIRPKEKRLNKDSVFTRVE
ncbi:MAG: phage/plasmid primase, P4 family [Pseudomonadota bacterium]